MVYLQPDEKNQDIFRDGFEFTMGANSSNPEEGSDNEQVSPLFEIKFFYIWKMLSLDYGKSQLRYIFHYFRTIQ